MRQILATTALALAAVGCDGVVRISGMVLDSDTKRAIEGARICLADRVLNSRMDKYLTGSEAPPPPGKCLAVSTAEGRYGAEETIAGPGSHDVWMVVLKPGYGSHRARIWKGTGLPNPATRPVDALLEQTD